MLTEEEIFELVRSVLVDSLNVSKDEVMAEARLKTDLGADSIYFLDIAFRLEKSLKIKIRKGLNFDFHDILRQSDFNGGELTREGIERIKTVPSSWVDRRKLREGASKDDLFTVQGVCDAMYRMLERQEEVGAKKKAGASAAS